MQQQSVNNLQSTYQNPLQNPYNLDIGDNGLHIRLEENGKSETNIPATNKTTGMKGYKCITWDPDQEKYLLDNYRTKTNQQLAKDILQIFGTRRTADAVRKQLNKMELRRHKKTEVKKQRNKARKGFFNSLSEARERKEELQRIRKKMERKQKKENDEKEWAKKYMNKERPLVLSEPPKKWKEVPVQIDHRTIIMVREDRVQQTIAKYKDKIIPK